jgi:hypothetical protein
MPHFDLSQWTDFVRGISPALDKQAMAIHLTGGCEPCSRIVALLMRVCQESAREPEVPKRLTAGAKAVFRARRSRAESPAWMLLPRLTPKVVFDSRAQLLQAGARAAPQPLMQLVYHAGDYAIELQMECEPDSPEIAVMGQVVHRAGFEKPLDRLPVLLMLRDRLIARTETNQCGEFCLTSRIQKGLKLSMPVQGMGKRLEIPLHRIAD